MVTYEGLNFCGLGNKDDFSWITNPQNSVTLRYQLMLFVTVDSLVSWLVCVSVASYMLCCIPCSYVVMTIGIDFPIVSIGLHSNRKRKIITGF